MTQGPAHASTLSHGNDPIVLTPVQTRLLEDIRQIEFQNIDYRRKDPNYFSFIEGNIPILISAPHGAMHFRKRENRWKGEDEYTASLAIKLGQLTGAHVLYVKNKTWEDPNNDPKSQYKTTLRKIVEKYHIKFLLDLHGSDEDRPYKVDIGTIQDDAAHSSCPTLKATIQECLSDLGPRLFNQRFSANDPCTITFFAKNELEIEAAQVEINARLRIVERKPDSVRALNGIAPNFKANPKDVLDLVTHLEELINVVAKEIADGSACPSGQGPPAADR